MEITLIAAILVIIVAIILYSGGMVLTAMATIMVLIIVVVIPRLFKSKKQRLAERLEYRILAIEAAYAKGEHDLAYYNTHKLISIDREIARSGLWEKEELENWLTQRGLVKSTVDDKLSAPIWRDLGP